MGKRDSSSRSIHRKRSSKNESPAEKKPKMEDLMKQWDALDKEEEKQSTITATHIEANLSRSCPYLDTINRHMLDFDFEKLCSVSLSHLNVYACLVCGKYFQGRGPTTHVHTHSVDENHHVFLNLETHRFYCLPDNYEIIDGSLEDITYLLNPLFQRDGILKLDTSSSMVRAYNGLTYYPGFVGLNNIKANDYCNVILQLLSHISPLRDYFLCPENYAAQIKRAAAGDHMTLLVHRFGELIRKLWNPRNFKTHVSPHEFLQAVVLCSKKRFQITEQADALDFLSWLLNALDQTLKPSKGQHNQKQPVKPTIIGNILRGRMVIHSQKMMSVNLTTEQKEQYSTDPEYMPRVEESRFLYLTCDLPPPPLYLDEFKESIIPQVPLASLLTKFNGVNEKEYKTHRDSTMRRFCLKRLPPYLILFMKRIVKNIFTLEKNPTIVNFPIKSIDFGELLDAETRAHHKYTTYDLVANVVHDGPPTPGEGNHRVFVLQRGTGKWFEMQDLHVNEVLPQMIPLSESLIQVWAVNKNIKNPFYTKPNKVVSETKPGTSTTAPPTKFQDKTETVAIAASIVAEAVTDAEMGIVQSVPEPDDAEKPTTASTEIASKN